MLKLGNTIMIFLSALLRHNPYIIQFIHLKHAILWSLVYSQSCTTTIITIDFRIDFIFIFLELMFHHPQKKPHMPNYLSLRILSNPTNLKQLLLCLYRVAYFGHFIQMESYNLWLSVLFHLP